MDQQQRPDYGRRIATEGVGIPRPNETPPGDVTPKPKASAYFSLLASFPDNPAVLTAGPLGTAMYVSCMAYVARHNTANAIPASVLPTLQNWERDGADWREVAQRLIDAGLMELGRNGYRLVDYGA